MAKGGKASRIFILATVGIALTAAALHFGFAPKATADAPTACNAIPSNMTLIGLPQTVAEIEAHSIQELRSAPSHIPRVPFGKSNAEWVALKSRLHPGDRIIKFRTPITGGYVAIRQRCLVWQLTEWIR